MGKKTTPLRKLMDAYCSRLGLQASQVRFMVDGERIAPDDTAEKLGLEDEDLIDVAMEQTGGAMKAMKAMKSGTAMSASAVYSKVAESLGLKPKNVKDAVEGFMAVGVTQLKKSGSF